MTAAAGSHVRMRRAIQPATHSAKLEAGPPAPSPGQTRSSEPSKLSATRTRVGACRGAQPETELRAGGGCPLRRSLSASLSYTGVITTRSAHSGPKVGLANHLVLEQAFGRVMQDNLAGLQDVSPLGHLQRHERVLLNQQNRRPGLVDVA